MSVIAINALATPGSLNDVVDAMRSVQTEADRWILAEALVELIPTGEGGFQEVIDRATSEGLLGNFTVNTLRLYRDTAKRWDKDKRVTDVSFSAHREAMSVKGDITAAAKLLAAQVKTVGAPAKVTASSVRKAVRLANGKAPLATAKTAPTVGPQFDLVADLKHGGKKLAAMIGPDTSVSDLDSLHAGLNKVIAHVEKLRGKAARKASAAKTAKQTVAAKPTASKATTAKRPAARKQAGDLRGL